MLAYEIFAIKKYDALIKGGKALEKALRLPNARFTSRPNNVLHVINEPFAAAAIYSAVLAAWTYLALFFDQSHRGKIISPIVFIVGFAGILLWTQEDAGGPSSTPSPAGLAYFMVVSVNL